MKHIKLFESFVNDKGELVDFKPDSESTISNNGELDFKGEYDSSMMFTDSEFKEWLETGLENMKTEEISGIYNELSNEHKEETIKGFLDYNVMLDTENISKEMVLDSIKHFPKEFDTYLKDNIHYWWDFGNGVLEWNTDLIEILPNEIQEKVAYYIEEQGEYLLEMDKIMFDAFNTATQERILRTNLFAIL